MRDQLPRQYKQSYRVAAPALQSTEERGRNITTCSGDSEEKKLNWMSQLLSSILTLLQNQTDLQLEDLNTGGQVDCTLLFILRSLSRDQLEELRPAVELHHDCNSDSCSGQLLTPVGNCDN
jgi:hypothetical protein